MKSRDASLLEEKSQLVISPFFLLFRTLPAAYLFLPPAVLDVLLDVYLFYSNLFPHILFFCFFFIFIFYLLLFLYAGSSISRCFFRYSFSVGG
jgi:hypothetical protein